MGGAATAKERQAALRDRRRKDGLNYIHVWANADQERAIKAFLADPAANPLHVTHQPHDAAIDAEAAKLRDDLARRAEETEATYRQYKVWADEAEERLEGIRQRERELAKQERELTAAGARLERAGASNAMTDKARTEALIHRFTTERDYRQPGEVYKPIVDDYRIEQRAKEVSKLTARTKTVRTSLVTLTHEFKDLLGDKEAADLDDAIRILSRIGSAATSAQKRTRALEAKIKEEEKQRQAQAYKAATTYLQGLGDAEQVMRLCILDPHSYELDKFLDGWPSYLSDVKGHTNSAVVKKIKDALKAGQDLDQALVGLESLVVERMPKAKDTYGRRIEAAIAAVIAARLAKANGV